MDHLPPIPLLDLELVYLVLPLPLLLLRALVLANPLAVAFLLDLVALLQVLEDRHRLVDLEASHLVVSLVHPHLVSLDGLDHLEDLVSRQWLLVSTEN